MTAVRLRLLKSYVGAIVIAILFVAAVNGLIKAAEPPLSRLAVLLFNRVVTRLFPDFMSLNMPDAYWGISGLSLIAGVMFGIVAFGLAGWLYADKIHSERDSC